MLVNVLFIILLRLNTHQSSTKKVQKPNKIVFLPLPDRKPVMRGLLFAFQGFAFASLASAFTVPVSRVSVRPTVLSPVRYRHSSTPHNLCAVTADADAAVTPPDSEVVMDASSSANPYMSCPVSPAMSLFSLMAVSSASTRLFTVTGWSQYFPAPLASCLALFTFFSLIDVSNPKGQNRLYQWFEPGSALLAKWLPLFFVPSLITLPLTPPPPPAELTKLIAIIVLGFLVSSGSTALAISGVRAMRSPTDVPSAETAPALTPSNSSTGSAAPYSFETLKNVFRVTKVTLFLSFLSTKLPQIPSGPVQFMYLLSATISSFVFGARLPKSFVSLVHPLITCTALTHVAIRVLALATNTPALDILKSYTLKSLTPPGAGDILLYLLGPAVVSLSVQMYSRRKLIKANLPEVTAGVTAGSLVGVLGTSFAARCLKSPAVRLSTVSRQITTPLAMAMAGMLGADVGVAVAMVVLTGLLGAATGAKLLTAVGVNNPVTRGLTIGAAAHGLGTAAMKDESDAFPFAAIGMALVGTFSTALVALPPIRSLIFKMLKP